MKSENKLERGVIEKENIKLIGISAKVAPDLLEKMNEIKSGLDINNTELVKRALQLYYASYKHALEKEGAAK